MEERREGGKTGKIDEGGMRIVANEKKIKPYKQFSAQINYMFLKMDSY